MRQSPRTRTGDVRIADFTTMVRVPDRPPEVRVYTDAERQEADRYAAQVGGEVVSLPLPGPPGYETGLDGSPVPLAPDD